MSRKFFLTVGIALVVLFGSLSALLSESDYHLNKQAAPKEQIVKSQEIES